MGFIEAADDYLFGQQLEPSVPQFPHEQLLQNSDIRQISILQN